MPARIYSSPPTSAPPKSASQSTMTSTSASLFDTVSVPTSGTQTPTAATPRTTIQPSACPHCSHCTGTGTDSFEASYTSARLHESFTSLEQTLRKHGADLHAIDLLLPTHPSRAPSTRSLCGDNASELSIDAPHTLLHDTEDVKRLTAGVTRLLKTLHDKVTAVEEAERRLRQEREDLAAQRRRSTSPRGIQIATPGRGSQDAAGPSPLTRAISFNDPDNAWTPDKEEQLKTLEKRLRNANKKWSDEQEDVLELIDTLQEERRRAKKAARGSRDSISIDFADAPLRRRDSKISIRSRRGSSVSEGGGSPKEKTEKTGLKRFFSRRGSKAAGGE
ncbi:hypothetical protein EDC01DRAFT_679184 [Geopyxis carbonaria]|nr:hypothetical protein EDC01DRAFT_679184 [Geopyxis carbonaria]